jgi:hypothetical protein
VYSIAGISSPHQPFAPHHSFQLVLRRITGAHKAYRLGDKGDSQSVSIAGWQLAG